MKRTKLYLAILLVLIPAAVLFFVRNPFKSFDVNPRSFSFKDTAAVTTIFLADKNGNACKLERTAGGWMANQKYKCRSEAILNLLEAIKQVDVKMPVRKEMQPAIIKELASGAVKVEVYAGDEMVRQYYVGHEAEDGEGSYMLLSDVGANKNFDEPFICWIPGFVGFLQPRFITNENEWRDRVVMNYIPPQLKAIQVDYAGAYTDSSFSIVLNGTTQFSLLTKGVSIAFEEVRMKQYLAYFQNLSYEVLLTGKSKKLQDSLYKAGPFCCMTLLRTDGTKDQYKFYRKQFLGDVNPDFGVRYDYDPDRLYMSFDNNKQWALIQYFVFGKILASPSYFKSSPSVKKN
jgi:hypothetical protein